MDKYYFNQFCPPYNIMFLDQKTRTYKEHYGSYDIPLGYTAYGNALFYKNIVSNRDIGMDKWEIRYLQFPKKCSNDGLC